MKIGIDVITPKSPLYDVGKLERVVENFLNMQAAAIKVDFEVTQQTWTHKAGFRVRKSGKWERTISTGDEPYIFVDQGTKPHIIRPVRAQKLAFQTTYTRKTLTGKILSRQGGSTGPTVFANEVHHPGNEPRNFSKTIAEKWEKENPTQLSRAIGAAV